MSRIQAIPIRINGRDLYYLSGDDVEQLKNEANHAGFKLLRIQTLETTGCYWVGDSNNVEQLKNFINTDQQIVKIVIHRPRIGQKVLVNTDIVKLLEGKVVKNIGGKTIVGTISSVSGSDNIVDEFSILSEDEYFPKALGILSYNKWIAIILDSAGNVVGYGTILFSTSTPGSLNTRMKNMDNVK